MTCPHCGLAIPPKAKRSVAPVETTTLDDDGLFAHFKKTAPGLDLQFFMRHATLSPMLQQEAINLVSLTHGDGRLKGIGRSEFYHRLTCLQGRWRRETNRDEAREENAA